MPQLERLARSLGSVRHFQNLPAPDLEAIVSAGRVRRVPEGTAIFHEGGATAGLYVLLAGRVHLYKTGPQGQQVILAVVRPVIMFNEVAALDGGPNPVTAVTVEDSTVWHVSAEALHDLLLRYPQISRGMASMLATRNRFLVAQVEDLSFRTVLARTAKLLLDISDFGRVPIDRHTHPNVELAARIATVPEAFSRSLNVFRKNGCIETTRDAIAVAEPEMLAEAAEIGWELPDS
jgi:CRP/FNR family transcriptional regulator